MLLFCGYVYEVVLIVLCEVMLLFVGLFYDCMICIRDFRGLVCKWIVEIFMKLCMGDCL